ncbi:glycosyltransferase family 2 protein [Candidatus Magnetomonas plexicatena]|uniref:glycosyltransferase family 2 protein n=1 Tax=Candidatus Magnetomonas plexicatena TaxID=2552947 RepID=UPI0011023322|nr:glycosyltransferase family 2 protein [Nitrospirales bacterium LBB_01]
MLLGKKIAVVMPAYNAEKTLQQTYDEIPHEYVDEIIVVDDASKDSTPEVARKLGLKVIVHEKNLGYGGNQKTCYKNALVGGADVIVMLHPDYQYSPKLVTALAAMVISGHYDVALGSRILGGDALKGGMPSYKYVSNRFLTFFENIFLGIKLSEYHTGFRAFSRAVLETIPFENNSDDFIFDNQMIVQALHFGFKIGEISCPTKYFEEASSINFSRSVTYGIGVMGTSLQYFFQKKRIANYKIFENNKP